MDEDVCASSAVPWKMDLMRPKLFCWLRYVGHLHKPGSHLWTLCHSSTLWTRMWCFPWSHSIEDRAFLRNPSLEEKKNWLYCHNAGMFQVVSFGKEHLHNIKNNSTNETNTEVTKQTNVKEKNRERKVVVRRCLGSRNNSSATQIFNLRPQQPVSRFKSELWRVFFPITQHGA